MPLNTICYLCGQAIEIDQEWNKDHVPPQRFYGKSIRKRFNPNLQSLYTHAACNSDYKPDEEYYVAAFSGQADSMTGRAVFADWQRAVAKGHDTGLLRTIMGHFGRVVRADGSRLFTYDVDRAGHITWKLARGIYFAEVGRFLPGDLPKHMALLGHEEIRGIEDRYPFWPLVRDTEPMGLHGGVFDYKWLGIILDGVRGHLIAMALWDRLVLLVLFHDPTCVCPSCRETDGGHQ